MEDITDADYPHTKRVSKYMEKIRRISWFVSLKRYIWEFLKYAF